MTLLELMEENGFDPNDLLSAEVGEQPRGGWQVDAALDGYDDETRDIMITARFLRWGSRDTTPKTTR